MKLEVDLAAPCKTHTRLVQIDALYARTLSFASMLNQIPGTRTEPHIPQSNRLHVIFDIAPKALADARDAIGVEFQAWLFSRLKHADVPGWSRTKIYVEDQLLKLTDKQIKPWFEALIATGARMNTTRR